MRIFANGPMTLNEIRAFNPKAIAPGRGDALKGQTMVRESIAMTRDFITTLYGAAEIVGRERPRSQGDHGGRHAK